MQLQPYHTRIVCNTVSKHVRVVHSCLPLRFAFMVTMCLQCLRQCSVQGSARGQSRLQRPKVEGLAATPGTTPPDARRTELGQSTKHVVIGVMLGGSWWCDTMHQFSNRDTHSTNTNCDRSCTRYRQKSLITACVGHKTVLLWQEWGIVAASRKAVCPHS